MYYLLNGKLSPLHEPDGKWKCVGKFLRILLSFVVPILIVARSASWNKLANKRKFYEFRFIWLVEPATQHSFENWDFPAQSISRVFRFRVFPPRNESFFSFADNLLLYLGRWDVDVAIERDGEIERAGKRKKNKEKS